jgi:hypothetical protein
VATAQRWAITAYDLHCERGLRSVKRTLMDSGTEARFTHKREVLPSKRKIC